LNKDNKEQVDANAQLEIEEATIELDAPLIVLKTLSFQKIQTDLKMRNRTLIIRQLSAKGPQMDGRISGSIFLSGDLKQSVLNLTGKIKLHHLLLAGIGKGFQSLLSSEMKKEQDGISFRINGTIEKPAFSFAPS
jgi:type II secretion system protein N